MNESLCKRGDSHAIGVIGDATNSIKGLWEIVSPFFIQFLKPHPFGTILHFYLCLGKKIHHLKIF